MKFTSRPIEGAGPNEIALCEFLAKTDATMGTASYNPRATRDEIAGALLQAEQAMERGEFKYVAFGDNDETIEFADKEAYEQYESERRAKRIRSTPLSIDQG